MGLGKVAQVLIKEFGVNGSYRKVLTQTLNGKFYTKVFDSKGNTLINRVKTFDKSLVGNKKVITRKEAYILDHLNSSFHYGGKSQYNRIYNAEGKLIGTRQIDLLAIGKKDENPLELINSGDRIITKTCSTGSVTQICRNNIRKEFYLSNTGLGSRIDIFKLKNRTPNGYYNNRGLPQICEYSLLEDLPYGKRINLSIDEMREIEETNLKKILDYAKKMNIEIQTPQYYQSGNPHLHIPLWRPYKTDDTDKLAFSQALLSNLDNYI